MSRSLKHSWVIFGMAAMLSVSAAAQPANPPAPAPAAAAMEPAKARAIPPRREVAAEAGANKLNRRVAPHRLRRRKGVSAALSAIATANTGALSAPNPNIFVNAALVYNYESGRLYRLDASPGFLTTIVLRPGEHLVSKAAGDTVRWVLGETQQGQGDTAQELILIKPTRGALRTNLVLTTDQRSYFVEAVSHDLPVYTSIVSWTYPSDMPTLPDQRRQSLSQPNPSLPLFQHRSEPLASAIPLNLNFGYKLDHPRQSRAPNWQPTRVFDDGSKTYIEFPKTIDSMDAPPLFMVGPNNESELVNYRVRGRYYIVDRLMDRAELRLGGNPQLVVVISKTEADG